VAVSNWRKTQECACPRAFSDRQHNGNPRRRRARGRHRRHAAVADPQRGLGIGFTPLWQIRNLVDQGAVEVILEEFEAARIPIHAVWPPSKIPLAKTRLFADFLAARLKRERL
jgi:DNA-binding transcriptional LysR family regulator